MSIVLACLERQDKRMLDGCAPKHTAHALEGFSCVVFHQFFSLCWSTGR
jgi:hypothetical protein